MARQQTRDLPPLTTLRFFAAALVVIFHQSLHWLKPLAGELPRFEFNFIRTGYVSVGFFFVLSGFILTHVHLEPERGLNVSRRKFWVARFARIYPVYLLGFLLTAPVVIPLILSANSFMQGLARVGLSAVLALAGLQSWLPKFALRWNPPAWSLSVEAFFYLIFPLLAVQAARIQSRCTLLGGLTVAWLLGLAVPVLFYFHPLGVFGRGAATVEPPDVMWVNLVKFNPLLRLPDFIFGILLGRLFQLAPNRKSQAKPWFEDGAVALALLAIFCVMGVSDRIPYQIVHNGLLTPLFGVVIYFLARGNGRIANVLSVRPLVFLGEISYALYILHEPLRALMEKAVEPSALNSTALFVIYFAATVLISSIAYLAIEEPCRKYIREKFNARGKRSISIAHMPIGLVKNR